MYNVFCEVLTVEYGKQKSINTNPIGIFILPMIAVVGIFGYYQEIYVLTYMAGVIMALGIPVKGFTKIIGAVIGWLVVEDFWLGASIGMCVEEIISTIGGLIIIKLLNSKR